MTTLRIAQVCADRGVVPGGTKGASQHLRGIAGGLIGLGQHVETFAARDTDGDFPAKVRRLDDLASCADLDVVYERYSLGHRGGLTTARRLGVPFVLEVNAPLVDEATTHRPETVEPEHGETELELLEAADVVITVAGELSDWVADRRGGPVITQPNGFEPSWFTWADDPHDRPRGAAFPLVFLGHPKPWHGADRILPLLSELARTGHRPRTLVIGGGPGAARLLAAADHIHLRGQVVVTGALPPAEASRLLSEAAIGLAPYPRRSPFYFCPLKVIDYLAAGLAVVSTDQGDIADLVGDAGIVIDDPDDDRALADAVRLLLDDDDRRVAMGRVGRRRARETMTWAHVSATTLQAIDRVVRVGDLRSHGASA
ncbi:MAG: glycosyltransferase [Ilumatobacter sp.]|uniref:glycosyltransferase family 4 protein n=1 Tax=Ilumatobacter sp. TaxID=1967498 RepID=UPI003298C6D5